MRPEFCVSAMCLDFLKVGEQLEVLNRLADGFHIDIMDGHFCENITLSPDFVRTVSRAAEKPIDVHLMTTTPNKWIEACAKGGAAMISPHAEAMNVDTFRTMNRIESFGCKIGVSLNPSTPMSYCRHFLNRVDILTIMTVDVGYAGQPFIPEMVAKVAEARRLREENGYKYKIMIDGACNKDTYAALHGAGADIYVLGSTGLFGLDSDLEKAWGMMKAEFFAATGVQL